MARISHDGRCLNIGEVGTVTLGLNWREFEEGLAHTNVTHLYISDRLHGHTESRWAVAKRHIKANRLRDRRHLFEHDVINAAIRLWFAPRASALYRIVFAKLPYEAARQLAHEPGKIKELFATNHKERRRVTWNKLGFDGYYIYCGVCWDGGELLLCDGGGIDGKGCPEVLHAECTTTVPEEGTPFLCESCRVMHYQDPTRALRQGWQNDRGSNEYEVEAILNSAVDVDPQTRVKTTMYLIKWKGYAEKHNTWEPRENLSNCPIIWEAFHRRCGSVPKHSANVVRSRRRPTAP